MNKRTFIAINITPEKEITDAINELKKSLKSFKINWVNTQKIHLTFFFIGDTTEEKITEVRKILKSVTDNFKDFDFIVKGFGFFGSKKNPRVLWFGVEENENLNLLQNLISQNLKNIGINSDKDKFSPHLTIGRIKFSENSEIIEKIENKYNKTIFQKVKVSEIIYYESILSSTVVVYKPIEIFKLK